MKEIIYGIHPVKHFLEKIPERFQKVYILSRRKDERFLSLIGLIKKRGIIVKFKNRLFFKKK